MHSTDNNTWLCRNCNTLVDIKLDTCPSCNALRPEDKVNNEAIPEGISQEVRIENYTNATPKVKPKYNFRESVLTTVADITLILGIFLTASILIAPQIVELQYSEYTTMLVSICVAAALFISSITTWALLRTVADISHRTREIHERE